jgi:hypothetical protein
MSKHPREHEDLLAALTAGERRPSEPEVERQLRSCDECATAWAEAQETQARLERLGVEERETLAELGRVRGAHGEERVLATLQRLAAGETGTRARRFGAGAWLAAAVLLLAGAWLVVRFRTAEEPHEPKWLGDGVRLEAPVGAVPSYGSFSWSYTGREVERFELKIYRSKSDPLDPPLLERRLTESTWTPDAKDLEQLPARIYWVVEAWDVFERSAGGHSAEAWLSSR